VYTLSFKVRKWNEIRYPTRYLPRKLGGGSVGQIEVKYSRVSIDEISVTLKMIHKTKIQIISVS
jgi:hypothetical protein